MSPMIEPIFTIVPPFFAAIWGKTACDNRRGPKTLVSNVFCASVREVSARGPAQEVERHSCIYSCSSPTWVRAASVVDDNIDATFALQYSLHHS